MGRRRHRKRLPEQPVQVRIENLSHDGRGVAHIDQKAVFIDGALPGELITFQYTGRQRKYDEGKVVSVDQASTDRVEPKCPHFGLCGGCALQHLDSGKQILAKQQVLLENLSLIGSVTPASVIPPLTGPHWGYRRKARLGVRFVAAKGRVLVGFREKRNNYVADMHVCPVLHPAVGEHIEDLAECIGAMHAKQRIAQIEVAVSDEDTVLVLRNLDPLDEHDTGLLETLETKLDVCIMLQPGGLDSVVPLSGQACDLFYQLPDEQITFRFKATDFTQVNTDINRAMVRQTLELLDLQSGDRVLDLFCGLGNFTLPIARHVASVTGVEGAEELIRRAADNARRNQIDNVDYHVADLGKPVADLSWMQARYDKILLDPPRSGAAELVELLPALGAQRIVYVSCHPGSLARDAGVLVERGYRLDMAGVMDMFPHTAHVESIALFEK